MRRGILNINDIAAYTTMVIIAVVIYLLFYFTAARLESKYENTEAQIDFAVQQGNLLLSTYLLTPLDAPIARYTTTGLGTVPAGSGTVRDALPGIFTDAACLSWLQTRTGNAPTTDCAAFRGRTIAYFQSVCGDEYLLDIKQGTTSFRLGQGIKDHLQNEQHQDLLIMHPSDSTSMQAGWVQDILDTADTPILVGSQAIPGIQLRALCIDRWGVSLDE